MFLDHADLYCRCVHDDEVRTRAVRIVVRSLIRDLLAQGFDNDAILAVAIELIGNVTEKYAAAAPRRA